MDYLIGAGVGFAAGGVVVYLYARKAIAKLQALLTAGAAEVKKVL
jgi:hypothetical protein